MFDKIPLYLVKERKELLKKLTYMENNLVWYQDKERCMNILKNIRNIDENLKLIDKLNTEE